MLDWIADVWEDSLGGKIFLVVILLGILVIPLAIKEVIQEQNEWEKYSQAHHCVVVGQLEPQTSTMIMNGKVGFITTPGTTTYRCDDGTTTTR